jgi:hypothetical protein
MSEKKTETKGKKLQKDKPKLEDVESKVVVEHLDKQQQ